jgi:hypothetical protein
LRGAPGCNGCHTTSGPPNFGIPGIPLYYADAIDYDGDSIAHNPTAMIPVLDPNDVHQLYLNVRARINFTDIEGSPLLRKPTGNHHCGFDPLNITGRPPGDPDPDRVLYDRLLNWILDGAPE